MIEFFRHSRIPGRDVGTRFFMSLFIAQYYYLYCGVLESDLAGRMGMTQVHLVDHDQNTYGLGFNALCDRCRVERFVDKIGYPKTENLTINTLIKASGFSNDESFERVEAQNQH